MGRPTQGSSPLKTGSTCRTLALVVFVNGGISKFRDLQPRVTSIVQQAFDKTRIRLRDHQVGFSDDLRTWDGRRFALYDRYDRSPDRNGYLINREPEKWLYWLLWANFDSFRAGPHVCWWHGPNERAEMIALSGKPEDFSYEGRTDFRGTSCHVVSRWESWTSLYIACEDGRLRGLRSGALNTTKLTHSLIDLLRRQA
jgi:hypothetical protein